MTIREHIDRHRAAAVQTWTKHGNLICKLWTESDECRVMAEPATPAARASDEDTKALLLYLMASASHATCLGRVDEAWMRENDGTPLPDDGLEALADLDPSVKTGLVVAALDVSTGELILGVGLAILDLNDAGQPVWSIADGDTGIAAVDTLHRAAEMIAGSQIVQADWPDLLRWSTELGWSVMVMPKTVPRSG